MLISYDTVLWHIQYVADIYCTLYFILRNQILRECLGALKIKKILKSEFTMKVGWWGGLVGAGLTRIFCFKSSQNSSKPVLIFSSSIQCVFCL